MCGIAGWIGPGRHGEVYASRMADALRHRGPDASGIWSSTEGGLIHTRLAIIDLSPTGAQPMSNEDGTVWTVFNGEIYNHRELRQRLEDRGHVFRGRSDTEVLPHLYEEEGPEFVSRLHGMFALAIYDERARTLLLARDRFGIKPLFYGRAADRLIFASEIGALLEWDDIDDRPDPQSISDFAALFYIPAPQTFYADVRAVQPGETLVARFDGRRVRHDTRLYHRWVIAPDPTLTLARAEERAAELLTSAVHRQLQSDVPLGAFLSGGIDSSLVSAAAQVALTGELSTFNVQFAEQQYDETEAAVAVARHIGSRHRTLHMGDVRGSWDHVVGLLRHTGQPFADTSLFAVNAVCRLMRQHATVALAGDGGDEGFGGYSLFRMIAAITAWRRLPAPFWRAAGSALTALERLAIVPPRRPQQATLLATADDVAIVEYLLCWVRREEHARLCRDLDALPVRRLFEPQWEQRLPARAVRVERLSALTTEVYTRLSMANDYLVKVDIASMRESLEVRVPMLDEELFAFGLSLPHSLKVRGRTSKRVLRAVAGKWLPPAVARKRKQGFGIPVDSWVDREFKVRFADTLLSPSCRVREFFRPEAYQPIVEAFCSARPCPGISRQGLYQRAIMLLSLHLALDRSRSKRIDACSWPAVASR
jgi:asparagine synthase (glutamine-hydrolysing)